VAGGGGGEVLLDGGEEGGEEEVAWVVPELGHAFWGGGGREGGREG